MKTNLFRLLAGLNLLLLLGVLAYEIHKKERTLADGQLVLLELAPVDPRSLMQGDYMSLRYAETQELYYGDSLAPRGYMIMKLDSVGVGHLLRSQTTLQPLNNGEIPIKYFYNGTWFVSIGAESYFFEEGQAERFDRAKYGGLKVNSNGESLLVGLYDSLQQLIPAAETSK